MDEKRDYSDEHNEGQDEHLPGGGETTEKMGVGKYLATRFSTLKPPMEKLENPITLLRMLNFKQWMFFLCSFIAWTWDAFDFFTVSLTVSNLAEQFDKSKRDITWGITLVLMFRSVGAVTFGLAADRYGRKWPFVVNNLLFIALELGTGFCNTYSQFLAVRALFGIAMGGLYGNVAAMALEDCPEKARGIISGMLQQGYAFGYLLATVFARALVDTTPHAWRPLFWFGGSVPVLIIAFRLCLGETDAYNERVRVRESADNVGKTFVNEGKVALKRHWMLLIYMVLLMAGFNFMSHGSQDLYPTMLENQYSFSANAVTVTQVVANLGAIAGGTTIGYLSQAFGRRFSIIFISIVGGAILYPYSFVPNERIMAAAFFEQFCVQGAWGVIPIHLMELSPGSLRAFVVGTSYQLGNLVSSASSTIEATIGERFPLPPKVEDGKSVARYEYGKVICIFMGCVYAYVILLTFLGPETRGRSMSASNDRDLAEAAGQDAVAHAKHGDVYRKGSNSDDENMRTVA
ncbi:Carboxylic acid transporter [Fulvia fulva]|uniref:Carboxylic acid transporter n=1 Tax=Passalora fulva TaxID=5499 RepID=A0A9Q8LAZ0_PASFU|nr:Carboxylic acid transporter [Fulvia fulva]KAK4630900.1 Carboxylic acid transporter [Fulvia fulva]KAK4632534.1 Carboxylic acid transporter [Fulvia fulva]UJO14052.1 Carboxylic acid transporter [Fulvia fulva]WPV11690.1 Carboxylic acid transporter [Fulvia fulva]WPV25512.1 Carboxylic acid transporter [Fulvia fulva]